MVITNQKQANCPSQAQAMGTCPMGTRVRERGMGSFKEPSQEAALPRTTSSFTNTGQQVYLQHQDRDKAPGDDGGPRFGEGANLGNG